MREIHGAQEAYGCEYDLPEQGDETLALDWAYVQDAGECSIDHNCSKLNLIG